MRLIPATLAVLTLACISTIAYAADIGFQKTLTASGKTELNVCSNSGVTHVIGADGNKIEISAKIHKSNWHAFGNADDMKKIVATPPIHQTGATIRVGDSDTCGGNVLQDVDIDYEISVPRNANLLVRSKAGTIHVESVNGFVVASTGSGDIVANGIGSDSKLETGSGNITADNMKGGVRANTGNGNLAMTGSPSSGWEMRAGNGTIHLQADPSAKFSLDAETGAGTIDSTLPSPLSGHITNGVLRGPVRGGGPAVKMYTGSGNISLQ
jgi:DUF4097 and DUF4098 domain-containing protein YvlB